MFNRFQGRRYTAKQDNMMKWIIILTIVTILLTIIGLNNGSLVNQTPIQKHGATVTTMHYQDSPPTNMVIDQQNGIQWNKPLRQK
jgi:hypothetical protein